MALIVKGEQKIISKEEMKKLIEKNLKKEDQFAGLSPAYWSSLILFFSTRFFISSLEIVFVSPLTISAIIFSPFSLLF